jgi:SPOR domain
VATEEKVVNVPPLGEEGEPCPNCAAPLASDQRYCLNCGQRRGDARVPYTALLAARTSAPADGTPPPGTPPPHAPRDWTPLIALGGLGALALVLVVGVLIGRTAFGGDKAAPQVIRLGGGATAAGGTGATTADASFKSDWPAGKQGWTVEIGTLPKDGTSPAAVQAAKQQAQSKGASAVGALDADQYPSLPGGKYVVYSGVYDSKAKAAAALKGIKSKFPSAKVVQVSDKGGGGGTANYSGKKKATVSKGALQSLNNLSGNNYEKQSKKLPDTTVLPGTPPPTDNQAPGGGSSGETIK